MPADDTRPASARLVSQRGCKCGENPLWHPEDSAVYWIDIPTGRLFRLDVDAAGRPIGGGEAETVREGPALGAVSLEADGALLLLGAEGRVERFARGETTVVHEALTPGARFNDCVADPAGRLYTGTMSNWVDGEPDMTGAMYRLDPDGSVHRLEGGFGIPNGWGFTPDGRHLYFTDTTPGRIYRYAYDAGTGDLSDREVFFEEPGCGCDGMTMDEAGNPWSARWGGHGVWRHDAATGVAQQAIELPVEAVTSIEFCGVGFGAAYLTTAQGDPDEPDASLNGGLFFAELPGVRGAGRHRSRIACG